MRATVLKTDFREMRKHFTMLNHSWLVMRVPF